MAEFSKLVITGKGQDLIAKMLAGKKSIEFTKIGVSSRQYTLTELETLETLDEVRQTGAVTNIAWTDKAAVKVETAFNNKDLTEGYYMRSLGLYAKESGAEEVLYAVAAETSGNSYMPSYNGHTVSGVCIRLVTTVGNAQNVSLEVDEAAAATVGDVQELREQVEDIKAKMPPAPKILWNGGLFRGGSVEFVVPKECFHNGNLSLVIESFEIKNSAPVCRGYGTTNIFITLSFSGALKPSEEKVMVYPYYSDEGEALVMVPARNAVNKKNETDISILRVGVERVTDTRYAICRISFLNDYVYEDIVFTCVSAYIPSDI